MGGLQFDVRSLQHQNYEPTKKGIRSTGAGYTVWGALLSASEVDGVKPGDSVCNSVVARSKNPSDFIVEVVAHTGVSAPWLIAQKHVSGSDFTNPDNSHAKPKKTNVFSVCGTVPDNFPSQFEFRVHSRGAGNNYLGMIGSIHPDGTEIHNSNSKMTTLYDGWVESGVVAVMAMNANNGNPVVFNYRKRNELGDNDEPIVAFGAALITTPPYESLRLKIRADQPDDIPTMFITHADTHTWDWQVAISDAQSAYEEAKPYLEWAWWAISLVF